MIIAASELKVGSHLYESDGYEWDVVEIVKRTPKTITVRICSDFSSFERHWRVRRDGTLGGLIKTLRTSTKFMLNILAHTSRAGRLIPAGCKMERSTQNG